MLASEAVQECDFYVSVSSGILKVSKPVIDGEGKRTWKKTDERWIAGKITSIWLADDTFDGKTIKKIKFHLKDFEQNKIAQVSVTLESWAAQNTLAYLLSPTFDFNLVTTIGASGSEDSKASFIWMKQANKLEKSPEVPKTNQVRGKTTWDEFYDFSQIAVPELQKKLEAIYGDGKTVEPTEVVTTEPDDEIPF